MRLAILNKFIFAAAALGLGAALSIAAAATGDTVSAPDAAIAKKLTHEIRMYPRYTIFDNISVFVNEGRVEYRMEWVGEARHNEIAEAARRLGTDRIKTLKDALPADVTYEELRLVVASLKREPRREQ